MKEKQRILRRITSLALTICMVLSMLPATLTAYAETGVSYLKEDGTCDTVTTYTTVTADSTIWSDSWYVVSGEVTIDSRVTVDGTVNLILCDGATLNANSGIEVSGSNSLIIYAQSTGESMGTLNAIRGEYNAGIGGNGDSGNWDLETRHAGTIMIHGGKVTVSGEGDTRALGAGIGGGYSGNAGNITITGGIVTTDCGGTGYGAGIGGGDYGNSGNITITGGTVTAYGSSGDMGFGAGIGGGMYGDGETITIKGGIVTAYSSYSDAGRGSGIGCGEGGQSGTIAITGGIVTAYSSYSDEGYGAGIGCGEEGRGGTIAITGGIVTAYSSYSDRGYGAGIGCGAAMYEDSYSIFDKIEITNAEVTAKSTQGSALSATKKDITYDTRYKYKTSESGELTAKEKGEYSYSDTQYLYIAPISDTDSIYKVDFDKNAIDATGIMDSQLIFTGTETTLAKNKFSRTGFDFSGWATTATGTVQYVDEANVRDLCGEDESITLYAVWTLAEPDVTVGASPSDDVSYGEAVTLTAIIGNKSDNLTYTYAWYKDGENDPIGDKESLTLKEVSESGEYRVKVTATGGGAQKSKESSPVTVTINPATLDIGTVSAETVENTLDVSEVKLNRTNETIAGELKLTDTELRWGEHEYNWQFIPDSKYNENYDTATGTVKITVTDSIAPAAMYQLGTNAEREFTTGTGFSIFCKESETVTLTYSDEVSGVKSVQYYIANEEIADTQTITEWTDYDDEQKISLEESGKYFVYVRLEDNAGNTAIYHTEGIVIYEESVIDSETVEYTYKQNEELTVSIDLKGNSIKEITDQNGNTLDSSAYTITEDGIVLSASYLDSLNVGEYTYTLTQYPQGIEKNEITCSFKLSVEKAELTVEKPDKSYLYLRENTDTIDLASLLPADCGTVTYRTTSVSGNVTYSVAPVINGDELSYTVGIGNVGDTGAITIEVETQNYEDITIVVNVQLIEQISVSLKEGSDVTLKNDTLTYGEALSNLVFNSAVFVGADGKEVTGTLAWKDEAATPDAGTISAKWVFTPENIEYASLEGTVGITVNKATPVISAVPTVGDIVYNPNVSLSDEALQGGAVSVNGNTLSGTWSWQNANIVPIVNNDGYVVVFTPTDSTNYNQVTTTTTVTVTKATPHIETAPSAAAITYGEELSVSVLRGSAQYSSTDPTTVAGSYTWKDSTVKPTVADSNSTAYTVVFTPVDEANYNSVETTTTLIVNKAENAPNMPDSTMNVPNNNKKISDVALPDDWVWQEADKNIDLTPGTPVNATAVYTGEDKDNYENVAITIAITRIICEHELGEILYTGEGEHEAACEVPGLGHRECTKCGDTIEEGIVTEALKHIGGTASCTKKAVCTRCQHEYGELDATNHGETEVRDAKMATCKEEGYTGDTYCKACGVKVSAGQAIAKLIAHTWNDGEVTKEATCTEAGEKTYTCTVCETIKPEEIQAVGHTGGTASCTKKAVCTRCQHEYGELDATNHGETEVRDAKMATCKEEGYTGDTYCKDCGEKVSAGQAIAKLTAHTWNDGEVTKEATCTEAGEKTYTCTVCETIKPEEIQAVGHTGGTASCTKKAVCTRCQHEYGELDATNHGETEVRDAKTATCKEEGYTGDTYCKDCGVKVSAGQAIDKLTTHTWNDGEVTKEATCTEAGEKTYTCTVCETTKPEEIQVVGHTGGTATCTKKAVCTRCQHEYGELDATNHGETEVRDAKTATCKEEGYTGDTNCKACGVNVSAGQAIDKLTTHTWNDGEVTKEATCTEAGEKTYTCTVCETTKPEEIQAVGHTGGTASCTKKAVCTRCQHEYGELDATNHGETEVRDAKTATCKEEGYTGDTYCKACGVKVSAGQAIAKLTAHTWNEGAVTKEASCTEAGEKTYTCTVCETTKTEEIQAVGHTGGTATCTKKAVCTRCQHEYGELDANNHGETEVKDAKAATCKEEGYTGDTYCKACGVKVSAGQAIAKLTAHTWNEGAVTKEPTVAEKGTKTYTCTVCGVTQTEEIPALGGSTGDNSGNSTGSDNGGSSTGSDNTGSSGTVNGYTTLASAEKTLLATNTDKGDAKDSAFAKLQLKATGKKKSVKLTWKKVKDADGYIIYGARCGSSMKKLKTIKGSSKVTYTHTKLKAGKYYKYMVVAYKVVNGKKCIITTSKSAHAVTTSSKYANPTKVSVKSTKMTIKIGKKATIKASYTLPKGKKSQTHNAKFRYESSNTKVATVSKKGVVKAKKKGTAYIYVYAHNGIYKKVKITVK